MKKIIDNFIENLAIWKVLIVMLIASTLFVFMIFNILNFGALKEDKIFTTSIVIGVFIGCLFTFMVKMMRKSIEFWDAAEKLSKKVDETEELSVLKNIWNVELKELRKKASGTPHYNECNKIAIVINTKSKYLK